MKSSLRYLYDAFPKSAETYKEFIKEVRKEKDLKCIMKAINEARREALDEAANLCDGKLPTQWAVQDAIKNLKKQLDLDL